MLSQGERVFKSAKSLEFAKQKEMVFILLENWVSKISNLSSASETIFFFLFRKAEVESNTHARRNVLITVETPTNSQFRVHLPNLTDSISV